MNERASGYQRPVADEHKALLSDIHSKAVVCVDTGEVFKNCRLAGEKYG